VVLLIEQSIEPVQKETTMTDSNRSITAQRFAAGMTFAEYLDHIASPANLARENTDRTTARTDRSGDMRAWYEKVALADHQAAALRWLAAQPGGPRKLLVISEDWSSDCRRDVPVFARIAEAAGMELRIFDRDGQRTSYANRPEPGESPNADLMSMFLNEKNGNTWQSIPVAAFYNDHFEYLYHYTEYPAIYDKDRVVVAHIRGPRPGETPEQTRERGGREFQALVDSPFFRVWASATVDEIISALHRRAVLGTV
jgi:hypothetical protein